MEESAIVSSSNMLIDEHQKNSICDSEIGAGEPGQEIVTESNKESSYNFESSY